MTTDTAVNDDILISEVVPANTFVSKWLGQYNTGWMDWEAFPLILNAACSELGVTTYQIGKLLGVANYKCTPYEWKSGKRGISQKYLGRLVIVMILHSKGVDLVSLSGIDWEAGKPIRPKEPKNKNGVPKLKSARRKNG